MKMIDGIFSPQDSPVTFKPDLGLSVSHCDESLCCLLRSVQPGEAVSKQTNYSNSLITGLSLTDLHRGTVPYIETHSEHGEGPIDSCQTDFKDFPWVGVSVRECTCV